MADVHSQAAARLAESNPGDACIAVLDSAASGITRAAGTCGIFWAPNSGPLYNNPGAMPHNLGPDNALILINKLLQPPGAQMQDPHPSAQQGDSVGLGETVTHEALHATLSNMYFTLRHLLNSVQETRARSHSQMCFQEVAHPMLSDVGRSGPVVAGVLPTTRTGVLWWLALAVLGLAGLAWTVRRKVDGASESI